MRCYICDFSDHTPSGFYLGLQQERLVTHNRVIRDRKSGKPICLECSTRHNVLSRYNTDREDSELLELHFDNELT